MVTKMLSFLTVCCKSLRSTLILLNSFIIWISDKEASRIIQSHHVTCINERFFWPRVETRLVIALLFLPFGTPDSGSKFRRYQVFLRYHWASAGMTKGKRMSKRKRNVLRRLFLFPSLFPSNMHYWPSERSIWLDIWPNSFSWLVMPRDFVVRSVATRPHVSGAPNENVVQNHLNIELLNVF